MSGPAEQLAVESDVAPADLPFLDDRIDEHNVAATGIRDGQSLGIFMRDARGAIEAGLAGWTWGDVCRIDKLWVQAELRGSGLGQRLVRVAEQKAARRGCRQITLDTTASRPRRSIRSSVTSCGLCSRATRARIATAT